MDRRLKSRNMSSDEGVFHGSKKNSWAQLEESILPNVLFDLYKTKYRQT